jgi:L-methionine (R)-S-oxide reductase
MVTDKQTQYDQLFERLDALCEGESDVITLMSTIVCELNLSFEQFHWVGFYRNLGNRTLKVGPYQGGHGCLVIPFDQGVCGKCAATETVQNVPDVAGEPDHIACSATTKSEIVIPIMDAGGELIAVLDIDSNLPAAFGQIDQENLQRIGEYFQHSLA